MALKASACKVHGAIGAVPVLSSHEEAVFSVVHQNGW